MQHDNLQIKFKGKEIDGLYDDLVSLEVELDDELAGMFRFTLGMTMKKDGSRPYLDDDNLAIWTKVDIVAGLKDDTQLLISGHITHVKPSFGFSPEEARLEIWGVDKSVLMDREDKLKDWPNKKDSDIAMAILDTYKLSYTVQDTKVVHDDKVSTVIQRETDMQFLKRLALRNGFECYIDGNMAYFQKPQINGKPQPALNVQADCDTNVTHFSLEVNALAPANVTMFQVGRLDKQILNTTADKNSEDALGGKTPDKYLAAGIKPAVVFIGQTVTTGTPEMTNLCQGLFQRGSWFVTGEGDAAANQYGSVLKPRATVLIKGVGETYSGIYYVTHVTHSFKADGYKQKFRVKRNALTPTGKEKWSSSSSLLDGLL